MDKKQLEVAFDREFLDSRDNWKALCPFHDERTPSFLVHKDLYIANCFGCGVSGSIDILLSKYAGITTKEARNRLDIEVVRDVVFRKQKQAEELKAIPESWLAPWPKEIHRSILERGLSIEILRDAGVRFDPATKRQVFPHRDRSGILRGAAGRATDSREPKWFFYWDYSRGELLYIPKRRADEQHNSARRITLVEGIIDALKVSQACPDIEVGATQGTKFGKGQLSEIREYDEVVIAFDNDEAGEEATDKLYKAIRKSCRVEFINWSTCKDAGEMQDDLLKQKLVETKNYVQRKAIL